MSDARAQQSAVRVIGALGLVIAAVIHVIVAMPPASTIQWLFLLSALGTLVGAVLLLRTPRLGWIVGGIVAALTAIGYILRSTVGLPPLIPSASSFWTPPLGAVSAIIEILVAVLAIWALSGARTAVAARD